MADPMEVTPATGTTIDDNIDKDEIIVVPWQQQSVEEIHRWVGDTTPVLVRMLARLKKLSPDAAPMDEEQDLGGAGTVLEFISPLMYKPPGTDVLVAFADQLVEGILQVKYEGIDIDDNEYVYVDIKFSVTMLTTPTPEDPADPGLGDCYVCIESPYFSAGDIDRVVGGFTFEEVLPTDTNTPAYSMNIVTQADPSYGDLYRNFLKLEYNIAGVTSPVFPSEMTIDTKMYFHLLYKATREAPPPLFPGNPSFFFDMRIMASLFQDTLGTVPVTASGQPVRFITDLTGNGNNVVRTGGTDSFVTYETSTPVGPRMQSGASGGTFLKTAATGIAGSTEFTLITFFGNSVISASTALAIRLSSAALVDFLAIKTYPVIGLTAVSVSGDNSFQRVPYQNVVKGYAVFFDGSLAAANRIYAQFLGVDRVKTAGSGSSDSAAPVGVNRIAINQGVTNGYLIGAIGFNRLLTQTEVDQVNSYFMEPKYPLPKRTINLTLIDSVYSMTATTSINLSSGSVDGGDFGLVAFFTSGTPIWNPRPAGWEEISLSPTYNTPLQVYSNFNFDDPILGPNIAIPANPLTSCGIMMKITGGIGSWDFISTVAGLSTSTPANYIAPGFTALSDGIQVVVLAAHKDTQTGSPAIVGFTYVGASAADPSPLNNNKRIHVFYRSFSAGVIPTGLLTGFLFGPSGTALGHSKVFGLIW